MWGLVTPTPLIRIKLVRLTMRWWSALGLSLLSQVPLIVFPLRCCVMWGLVTPAPLLQIKLVRLTMRWWSALGLTFAQLGTPYYFSPTLPRHVGTRDPYLTYPNHTRSFDPAMMIGPGLTLFHTGLSSQSPPANTSIWPLYSPPRRRNRPLTLDGRLVITPPPRKSR